MNSATTVPILPRVAPPSSSTAGAAGVKPIVPVGTHTLAPMRAEAPQRAPASTATVAAVKPPVAVQRVPVAPRVEPSWLERASALGARIAEGVSDSKEWFERMRLVGFGAIVHGAQEFARDPRNYLANIGVGAVNSTPVPNALAPTPEREIPMLQTMGAVGGVVAEGMIGEIAALKALAFVASKGGRLGAFAQQALRAFGKGENLSARRQIAGAAALGVGVEGASQFAQAAVGDKSFEEAAAAMHPAAMFGGAIAGAAYTPKVVASVAKPIARLPFVERIVDRARDLFVYEYRVRGFRGSASAEDMSYNFSHDLRVADAMYQNADARAVDAARDFFAPLAARNIDVTRINPDDIEYVRRVVRLWAEAKWLQKSNRMEAFTNALDEYRAAYNAAPLEVKEVVESHIRLARIADEDRARFAEEMARAGIPKLDLGIKPVLHYSTSNEQYYNAIANVYRTQFEKGASGWLYNTAMRTNGVALSILPEDMADALRRGEVVNGLRLMMPQEGTRFSMKRAVDLAMGGPHSAEAMALPVEIAEVLERAKAGTKPPSWLQRVNRGTALWKSSVLFWSLSDFLTKNTISDLPTMARSFPGALKNKEAALRAFEHQRRFYRISAHNAKEPLAIAASGGALGALWGGTENVADVALGEKDEFDWANFARDSISGLLLGATGGMMNLGYRMAENRRTLAPVDIFDPEMWTTREELRHLADLGVIDSGYIGQELVQNEAFVAGVEKMARDARALVRDEVMTALTGTQWGTPAQAQKAVDAFSTIARSRENFVRMLAYYDQRSRGVSETLAAKRAREAFVDYGKATEFEQRWLSGFLLPFYAFTKQTIPQWIRAAAGKDVGGGGRTAQAAVLTIAGLDAASQAWNEEFFGDIERTLPTHVRTNWHLIVGNPATGEVLRDERGAPIVMGMEMPYEMALELLGIPRPAEVYSALFGNGITEDSSLLARWQRQEEFDLMRESKRAVFGAAWGRIKQLLSPALALPLEFASGNHLAWGSPIVQEWRDEAEWQQWLDHVGKRVVAAYGAARNINRSSESAFNSQFGAGLPVHAQTQDQALIWRLQDLMELAEGDERARQPLTARMRGLVREGLPPAEEQLRAMEIAREAADPEMAAYLMRYRGRAVGRRADLVRQWDEMSAMARAEFLQGLSEADLGALVVYMNGGRLYPPPSE